MPSIFQFTQHRPWPIPRAPWVMHQTRHDLLFAHWLVQVEDLRPHIPPILHFARLLHVAVWPLHRVV